jgi:ParB family chromosome partitioning protein
MSSFIGLDTPEKEKKKSVGFSELNNLFGIPDSPFEVVELQIADLSPRKNHRFHPSPQAKRDWILESIKQFGVEQPIHVRPAEDCAYKIDGKYEILSGHQRTELSRQAGKTTIPAIVKKGLTEEEAEQLVTELNMQRDWSDMTHSERAAVIAAHYNAQKRSNVRPQVLEEINSYLETYANPVNTRADEGLYPGGTNSVREVAEEHDLSPITISRYIRIDTLIDSLKRLLDNGAVPFKAAVQLSYISEDNQELFVSCMKNENGYKCNEEKAKLIREQEEKGKLTIVTMTDILAGTKVKKSPGKPKSFSVSGKIMKKYEQYFSPEQTKKDIEDVIDKALAMYFGEE